MVICRLTSCGVVLWLGLLFFIGAPWPASAESSEVIPTIVPRDTSEASLELTAAVLEAEPAVDGWSLEWEEVSEVVVPLWPTVARDPDNHLGPVDLRLKAGVFQENLYLLLTWPDPLPNATHLSWVWDFTRNRYRPGTDLEDRLALRFSWGQGFTACPLAGPPHKADLWLWRAARSNPVGLAQDSFQIVSDSPVSDGHPWKLPDGRVRWLSIQPDDGEPLTYTRSYTSYRGDIVPQFIVKKAEKLSGSRADVEAKGIWLEGFWTLEMARALETGSPDDIVFRRSSVVELAISAANHDQGAHESVSPLINLRLPPPSGQETPER